MSKILIELEFDRFDFESEEQIKKAVYDYLTELINDDSLDYQIED